MQNSVWQKLFTRKKSSRTSRVAQKAQSQLGVEGLEERAVPATGGVSGTVFQDLTGNGLAAAHTPESGVKVKVYADTNHSGSLDTGDWLVATKTTGADGSYSFSNLAPGRYFVTESTPSGFVRTAPAASSYYTVDVTGGQTVTGQDFANFQKPNRSVVTNVSFTVTAPDGTQTVVTNLRGQTQQGDTVTANFTISPTAPGPVFVSLAIYDAPGSSFNANDASQQVLDNVASGTFNPGQTGSLTVTIPGNFYQVDFVLGNAITQFGPAGSNVFFTPQGRLLSADNGGTQAFAESTVSGTVTGIDTSGVSSSLSGLSVTLTGTNDLGLTVTETVPTDTNGQYTFDDLRPGSYTVTVAFDTTVYTTTSSSLTVTVANGSTNGGNDFVLTAIPPTTTSGANL
jgi:hypothetical protein